MKVRLRPSFQFSQFQTLRSLSTSSRFQSSHPSNHTTQANSKWLSTTKSRIGHCIFFGLSPANCALAASILRILGSEWRSLISGREGFLTSPERAGLLRQKVVWGEMDIMGHVNNVTYVRYAESGRLEWMRNYVVHGGAVNEAEKRKWMELATPRGESGMILRSMRTDYKFPMTYPDHISVFHKLAHLPSHTDTHFVLDVMILSELHQRPAARCVEDIVMYDYKTAKKVPIRPFMMEAFERTWKEQEEEKTKVEKRIQEVESMLRELEKSTWDREGAVEEVGGP